MDIKERVFPNLPERLMGLEEIAENLWWSWHPAARMLFKTLDRRAWKESIHNPDKMLRELPTAILDSAAGDPDYLCEYDAVISQFRKYMEEACCLVGNTHDPNIHAIAYFSAEYGLHHSLPFWPVTTSKSAVTLECL
jgi:starch phosphorylase